MSSRLAVVGWGTLTLATVAVVVGLVLGWRPVVLVSDSMAPGAPTGALLIARPVAPDEVAVGDVVTVPAADAGTVTHRVIGVEELDGDRWARLQGDANQLPDAGRVLLVEGTLRTVAVVPVVGRLLAGADAVVLAGLALLGLGVVALTLRARPGNAEHDHAAATGVVTDRDDVDPRVVALAAALEAAVEDRTPPATVRAIARVRVGALLGRGDVETAQEAEQLDDGARFVLVAFADVDLDALAIVPAASARSRAARATVDVWWERVGRGVPDAVRAELGAILDPSQEPISPGSVMVGGVRGAAPVD